MRSELIEHMVRDAKKIDWTVTDSVLEAFILETNLIRTHKPRHNTISKDDKSFNHLVITKEKFPRILIVRGKDLVNQFAPEEIQYQFGPFPSGTLFKEAVKIIRRIFQYYDTKVPVGSEKSNMQRGKIDFNRQIGLYPHTIHSPVSNKSKRAKRSTMNGVGVYPHTQTEKEYKQTIRHIRLLFEGKKKQIIKELNNEMRRLAKAERFEEAGVLKKKIFALTHIQDVALIKNDLRTYRDDKLFRIEAYDVAHMGGSDMVGVMTVVENGKVRTSEYRTFNVKSVSGSNDPAALREVLSRRFDHPEWAYPQLIVVDGNTIQKNAAEHALKKHEMLIPVVAVVKDRKHKPERIIGPLNLRLKHHVIILLANAEAHRFSLLQHRKKRRRRNLQ
jgi:excinuclease ABC subunit C